MTALTTEALETLLEAGAHSVTPTEIEGERGGVEALVYPIPSNYRLERVTVVPPTDREAPLRNHGTIVVRDTRSLIAYVDKHRTPDTEFFADSEKGTVTAVLNAPGGPSSPAWADHRVVLQLTETDEWIAWSSNSGKFYDQETFANFFEEQSPVFLDPDAATMLDIASNFHATIDRQFASRVNSSNGQVQFTHNELIDGRTGSGDTLEVPKMFTIRLKVWESTRLLDISVLFRYRMSGGFKLGWKITQQKEIKRQVFDALVGDMATALGRETGNVINVANPADEGDVVEETERELAVIYTGADPTYRNI